MPGIQTPNPTYIGDKKRTRNRKTASRPDPNYDRPQGIQKGAVSPKLKDSFCKKCSRSLLTTKERAQHRRPRPKPRRHSWNNASTNPTPTPCSKTYEKKKKNGDNPPQPVRLNVIYRVGCKMKTGFCVRGRDPRCCVPRGQTFFWG